MKGVLAKMAKAVIMKFPLQKFIHNLYEETKKRQDEILRKKTNFLYREAYRYYLDLYLIRTANKKCIDIPAFYYETGIVICEEARHNAEKVMLEVIKDGRVNQCYTKRIKELRKRGF